MIEGLPTTGVDTRTELAGTVSDHIQVQVKAHFHHIHNQQKRHG